MFQEIVRISPEAEAKIIIIIIFCLLSKLEGIKKRKKILHKV
jgi:hypothetical protein